mgnify:FL=1
MNILYAVSEAFPFAKDGGLGDVAYAFPQTVRNMGQDIRVVMPLYDTIPTHYREQMELISNFTLNVSFQTLYCGLYRLELRGVTVYFVENDVYFMRGQLYGCRDDDARFAFFSKAVVESIRYMDWTPDVVHCNDWQTALVLFYLRDKQMKNPALRPIHTVFTIHNVEYQGNFSYQTLTDVFGLSGVLFSQGTLELDGKVNLMKGAIEIADRVTTVSPAYARELKAPDASGNLAEVIAAHEIVGIRNGIHGEINPFDCPHVHRPYTADTVDERVFNKLWMQEDMSLKLGEDIPVLGCVSRLLPRKGFDLLAEVLPEYLSRGAELVVCGNGKRDIKQLLQGLEEQYPEQVAVISYSEAHAAEVLSSIDLFLMPSVVEPCGTAQLQAMRYGAVPLVHATGGLRDTVKPYDDQHPDGWGFVFEDYTPEALKAAMDTALSAYYEDGALCPELTRSACDSCVFSDGVMGISV